MSRTIRRKRRRPPKDFADIRYTIKLHGRLYGKCYTMLEIDLDDHEYKKFNKAMWHRDTDIGWMSDNAPSWFRVYIERNRRGKNRAVTRNINKGNYEDYLYCPWRQDAGYYYW